MAAPRVRIRPWTMDDAEALHRLVQASRAELAPWLAWCRDSYVRADAEALWTGTAYQMVRLYLPDANDAESARLQTYRRLCRTYERQGKTAPEFLGTAELRALDAETWRGLWLSGEAEAVPELFTRTAVKPAEDDWWTQHV